MKAVLFEGTDAGYGNHLFAIEGIDFRPLHLLQKHRFSSEA